MADEPMALVTRALEQNERLIAGIRPGQETLPTPCRSWDVQDLVDHVVDEVGHFATVTVGEGRRHAGTDLGDDWAGAFRSKENIKPEYRGDEAGGGQIGQEVKVPADAPLYNRLAAFGGRDPNREPS